MSSYTVIDTHTADVRSLSSIAQGTFVRRVEAFSVKEDVLMVKVDPYHLLEME